MKTIVTILVLIVGISSCDKKNDIDTISLPDGNYTGEFYRTSPTGDWKVSNVKITLNKGSFSGESDMIKYPAICNGTYTVSNDTIVFKDQCAWTADFDWTLILSGTFQMSVQNDEIFLNRHYDQNNYDTYRLKKLSD